MPFFTDGALQAILPELARPRPTAEDPTILHKIVTTSPPPLLLIYIQRQWPDGRVCGRMVLYGQRLEYGGKVYIYRGGLRFHPNNSHYTSVICRGRQFYSCDDTRRTPITQAQAFSPYAPGIIQSLLYEALPS